MHDSTAFAHQLANAPTLIIIGKHLLSLLSSFTVIGCCRWLVAAVARLWRAAGGV